MHLTLESSFITRPSRERVPRPRSLRESIKRIRTTKRMSCCWFAAADHSKTCGALMRKLSPRRSSIAIFRSFRALAMRPIRLLQILQRIFVHPHRPERLKRPRKSNPSCSMKSTRRGTCFTAPLRINSIERFKTWKAVRRPAAGAGLLPPKPDVFENQTSARYAEISLFFA